MSLTKQEVLHIASLCRIALSPEEIEQLRNQLSNILEEFHILQQVDTTDMEPLGHSVNLQMVMREDIPESSMDKEQTLANSPDREGDFFKIKVVLEE